MFRAGVNADTIDMWINPAPATFGADTAPAATLADQGAGVSQASWTYIDRFFLRWSSTGSGYAKRVTDELRVGFSWADVTPPAPPALSIALTGTDAVLSWPTNNSSGYALEANAQVVDSGGWESVGQPVVVQGANYTVTVSAGSGQRFFRLAK